MLGEAEKGKSGLWGRLWHTLSPISYRLPHSPNSPIKVERISKTETDFSSKLGQGIGDALLDSAEG